MTKSQLPRISISANFKDKATLDLTTKKARSARDGVLEYHSLELGLIDEYGDRMLKVYRSPATIANLRDQMPGLRVVFDHIDIGAPTPSEHGIILDAYNVDLFDDELHSTIALEHNLNLPQSMIQRSADYSDMSLGYRATLVPTDRYGCDLEQRDLIADHLAQVQDGRNGDLISFIDSNSIVKEINMGKNDMEKKIVDEAVETPPDKKEVIDEEMTFAQMEEMALMLAESLKKLSPSQLTELGAPLASLRAILSKATEIENSGTVSSDVPEDKEGMDDSMSEGIKPEEFKDSAFFKDAVANAVSEHIAVIQKAKIFLDESFDYASKMPVEIMKAALESQGYKDVATRDVPAVFKHLKKVDLKDYSNFLKVENAPDKWEELKKHSKGEI